MNDKECGIKGIMIEMRKKKKGGRRDDDGRRKGAKNWIPHDPRAHSLHADAPNIRVDVSIAVCEDAVIHMKSMNGR